MAVPRRLRRQAGRHALVDGIPFTLPVASEGGPALMAAFPINADRAAELLPGNELHPIQMGRSAVLLVSVIDYRKTNIGTYIGMLMKSRIYFRGTMGFRVWREGSARFTLGDHPRADVLRRLEIGSRPLFTGFFPASAGVLDDHLECWFVSHAEPPVETPEGFESVIDLGRGETWLAPPGGEHAVDESAATAAAHPGAGHDSDD